MWRGIQRIRLGVHQGARLAQWHLNPTFFAGATLAKTTRAFDYKLYQKEISVFRDDTDAHPLLEAGKHHNLSLAAVEFDGLEITPHRPLSMQRQLGRLTRKRGYRAGMELHSGCIVPAIGGGVCLLSNALFAMALQLGWVILERHGHSMEAVPVDSEIWGIDATLFWPHVDLRIAPRRGTILLRVRIEKEKLYLTVFGKEPHSLVTRLWSVGDGIIHTERGRIRRNVILRETRDLDGGLLGIEPVARNRKRLLHSEQRRRNCITCNDDSCGSREAHLRAVA